MAYRLHPFASPKKAIIRCVRKTINDAADELTKGSCSSAEAIHLARTACKKARAALRLLKGSAPGLYTRENGQFRDRAQALSRFRDAESLVTCLSNLLRHYGVEPDCRRFAPLQQLLQTHRRAVMTNGQSISRELKRFTSRIRKASHRIDAMKLDKISYGSLLKGFLATYRRARHAGRKASANQASNTFHKWRKRVKTHCYQCRLLSPDLWPAMMKKREPQMTKLGNLLGDYHDLALLRHFLCDHGRCDINGEACIILFELIDARSLYLRTAAEPLGCRLFSEKPRAFKRRIRMWRKTAEAKA